MITDENIPEEQEGPLSNEDSEESIKNKDRSFLSASDEEQLNESLNMRRVAAKQLFNNGNPDRKDIRLLNEVLGGADALILKKAESRLKHSENKNNAVAAAALAVGVLQAIRSGKVDKDSLTVSGPGAMPELPQEFIDVAVVDGELSLSAGPLEIDDFVAAMPTDKG